MTSHDAVSAAFKGVAADTRVYELEIPLVDNRPPLHANQRLHWRPERALKKLVRDAVEWRAKEAKVGPCVRVFTEVHYRPGDNRQRDASNLMPTQKAAVDGLVRAGIVPDDSAHWVTERIPVLEPGDGPRRLWLRVEVVA